MERDISKVSLISTDSGSTAKSRKKITFDKELLQNMKSTDTQVEEFEKWMLGKTKLDLQLLPENCHYRSAHLKVRLRQKHS